jgi:4-amino-4-deoxy-L-arabinose transferase-like glycosyltransferase
VDPRSLRFQIAFLAAFLWGAAHLARTPSDVLPITGDSAKYDALARGVEQVIHRPSLAAGLVRGDLEPARRDSLGFDRWEFQHAPGYVVPLGVIYAIFPNNHGVGRGFSLLLYAASAGLLLLLADRLIGRRLAWVAVGLYLAYAPFLHYGLGIATEGPSAFFVLLAALALVRFHRRERPGRALAAGLALGLLFLAKTTFRPLVLALVVLEAVRLWRRAQPARLLRLALGAAAPVLGWTLVLALAHVPLNPLARTGEDALWAYRGNYVPDQGWETTGLGDAVTPELREASEGLAPPGDSVTPEDYATRRTMYERALRLTIARDPIGWLSLVATKFGLFWEHPARKIPTHTVLGAWIVPRWVHLLLFPLGLLGWARCLGRRDGTWIPGALALAVAAVHALTHLVARYHLPVLAVWFVYAILGARAVAGWLRDGWRHRARLRPGGWPWAAPGLWLAAWGAGALALAPPTPVGPGAGRGLWVAGALLAGLAPLALAPVVARLADAGRPPSLGRRAAVIVALLLFCLPRVGARLGDPDWDRFRVRLERPGQTLVQEIGRGAVLRGGAAAVDSVWLEIDALRSVGGSLRLEVRVQGERVRVLADTLDGAYADFLFDREAHEADGRYARLADVCRTFVRERLDRRYGARSPGYDYFRRWVRVPVPATALDRDTLRVELELTQVSGGAWVDVYGDRYPDPRRTFVGPALGDNPFEHSHYRLEFLCDDREEADARLVRPRPLVSPWSRSRRRDGARLTDDLDPGPRRAQGELRVRVRARIPGALAAREVDGRWVPVWATTLRPGEQWFGPQDIRRFQCRRDQYVDGTRVL